MVKIEIMDLRRDKDGNRKIGNIIEVTGDSSIGYFITEEGYRLVMDEYNMKRIADHYNQERR